MIKEQAELLQRDFVDLSKDHGCNKSYGYFVGKVGKSVMTFNNLSDNDVMDIVAQLIIRSANKHNMPVEGVLEVLREGIGEMLEKQKQN